nr:hypothetical protein [Tanacetum cinerariifolium]
MYAMMLFLVVITSTSSILGVSSNNHCDPEILTVVDNPTSIHHAGMGITKANPVQIGKFLLEDGKVLTLSRKSSPSRNCISGDQPCGAFDWCCEGLSCDGTFDGRCHPQSDCRAQGHPCALFNQCCFPYQCSGLTTGSVCV